MKTTLPSVLITGASSGIGVAYAERFARRGHTLVLVARNEERMQTLAARLRAETGVAIDVVTADLTDSAQLARVEQRLREDTTIGILVNNAGATAPGGLAEPNPDGDEQLIRLNIIAVTRLSEAVVPRFLRSGGGAIINLSSALAVAPEVLPGIYAGTKAYVLAFSQSLQNELGARGVYVQAVLPSATRTEIWERSGRDVAQIPGVMEVGDLVDAALVGFDRKELVTLPSLPDIGQWEAFQAARKAMLPNFRNAEPAARYRL